MAKKETKSKTFVLSDESINTYGFRVLLAGAMLEQFKRNPVLYYNHDTWSTPIGKWENIRIENNQLLADAVFDLEDEDAAKIAGKVERGFLRMASIGFRVLERSEEAHLMLPGQKYATITKWQLREASVVGIGANHNALKLYDKDDNLLTEEQIFQLFDNPQPKEAVTNKKAMRKEILQLLNLSDSASQMAIEEAITKLHDAKEQAESERDKAAADEAKLKKQLSEATQKLKDIDEAAKVAAKKEFDTELEKAFKDGRLSESTDNPGKIKKSWLELYDKGAEIALSALKSLTPHTPASNVELGDNKGSDAWAKRQKEIEEKCKH